MSPMVSSPLTIEHALLGFLHQQPRHGYEIYQLLMNPTGLGVVWRLKQNQLYALLAKLEREGYITATLEPPEVRPLRRVFQLTPLGQEAFLAWVQSPVQHGRHLRLDFLAKLYFAQQAGPTFAKQLLAQQQVTCRAWLTNEQARAERFQDKLAYDWLVHQFRLGQMEAMLNWLHICQEMFVTEGAGNRNQESA